MVSCLWSPFYLCEVFFPFFFLVWAAAYTAYNRLAMTFLFVVLYCGVLLFSVCVSVSLCLSVSLTFTLFVVDTVYGEGLGSLYPPCRRRPLFLTILKAKGRREEEVLQTP